jgi:type I restriction enzyme M protein
MEPDLPFFVPLPKRDELMAKPNSGASRDFEATLWATADKLRGTLDAAEYKHVVLGLIFLKYISDAFEERRAELQRLARDKESDYFVKDEAQRAQVLEDKDAYSEVNVFWVPPKARWSELQNSAKQPHIAQVIDGAMDAIERANPRLRGVLPADYARRNVAAERLGELIDLVGSIPLGDKKSKAKDVLGGVYEYFLGKFAAAEGKLGGEFFTATCVVRLLVRMLEPYKGRVFDPCCGSAGMFVQSEKFVEEHQGRIGDISIYGQESNPTTWKLAHMNLAIRGIEAHLGQSWADSFLNDQHKDLKADFILANPPFNVSDWSGHLLRDDPRWQYGIPPLGNANYAWIQHFLYHLAPSGTAGFVMANGSLSSGQSGEGDIRKSIIEADLVDCIVALPGQLFFTTQIPVCLWLLTRNKGERKPRNGLPGFRDRRGQTLFIDARTMGALISRVQRELREDDEVDEIGQIADTYHAWRNQGGQYEDKLGFCKSAKLDEIRKHNCVLTPGRYVGAAEIESDPAAFQDKMCSFSKALEGQFNESAKLQRAISANLKGMGFGE